MVSEKPSCSHSTSPPFSLVLSLSTSPSFSIAPLHFSLGSNLCRPLLYHSFSTAPLPLSLAATRPSPMPLPSRPYPRSTTWTKGEQIAVSFDAKGQPLGKEGDELQSWIGVLAQEHIPIWISDFRSTDLAPRKERLWVEVFEKTGQWVARHTVWLDMSVKPGEKFKNPSFKIIGNMIEDFSEQETQGSFESVGTNDILTKSLGNVEHSGQTRGQSKFVKQSHYFNIVQSSSENVEVSEVKRQLATLE
ncbi:hypothetical protein TIFTF001_015334 [Ficus carica]|uniref:Uncharacterized protein n=1 Tax=Ficus carica TaxID=3494 RepID=A0AA88ALD3_FICCA|nr:hypothetical protein TIFTF001_015334 [Ficus carica]